MRRSPRWRARSAGWRAAGWAPPGPGLRGAMRAHPALVAYPGAIDTELMAATPVVAKIGAEGVIAIGCEDGRGLAVKVADGALRALDPAAVWAVRDVLGLPVARRRARGARAARRAQLARGGRRAPRRGDVLLADDGHVVRASDRGPARRPTTGCQSADTLPRCLLPSAS